ncbi:MAG: hypothetical protein WD669_11740 [Pirellulales bacterium]
MTEETLRKFCESRHRTLIVIAGTFVVGLLLVLPIVDVYYAGRAEKSAVIVDLESARTVAAGMEDYEQRVAEKLAQLTALEASTVDEASLPVLRSKLVDLAKEAACNIRRLNVGVTSSRPWNPDDDPMTPKPAAKPDENATPFVLEWRPVNLSLSGTSENLRTLIDKIAASGMFMHTKTMEMYPSSPTRQSLTLDMELWYFTLARRG